MESKESTSNNEASKQTAEIKLMTFDEIAAIIESGDSDKLKEVIEAGRVGDINTKNENSQSLLMVAYRILYRSIECVKILLDHNADINYQTDYGSVLKCAFLNKNVDMLNLMIERGAYFRVVYSDSSEAAAREGDTVKLIVGRHMTAANILELSVKYALQLASRGGRMDDVQRLMAYGADADALNCALCAAIDGNHVEVAIYLLDHGADYNDERTSILTGRDAHTPWLHACFRGSLAMVQLLLDRGANPLSVDDGDTAPIGAALLLPNVDALKILLELGANPDQYHYCGSTVLLEIVLAYEDQEQSQALALLLEFEADPNLAQEFTGTTPLMKAALNRSIDDVRLLLDYGADVNQVNSEGKSVLDMLVGEEYREVRELCQADHRPVLK